MDLYDLLIASCLSENWGVVNLSQELHLHGNSMGNEGARTLMSGLSARKGFFLIQKVFQK